MRDRRDLTDGPDTLRDIPIVGRERAEREGIQGRERHERPEPEAHVLARVLALAAEEQSFCVFDDVIAGGGLGSSSLCTDPTHDDALGVFDQLAIQAVVSQVTSSGTTLTVAIEHSADRARVALYVRARSR